MNPQTRNNIIVLGVLAVIGLGVGGYFGIQYVWRKSVLSPFEKNLADYTSQPKQSGAAGPGRAATAKGKIITVSRGAKDELD